MGGGSAAYGSPGVLAAAPGSREPSCFELLALSQLPPERQPPERTRLCSFYAGSCRAALGQAACARLAEETCRARARRCGETTPGHGGCVWLGTGGGMPCRHGARDVVLLLHPQSCTPTPRRWWVSCAGPGTSSGTRSTSPSSPTPCPSSWARSTGTSSPPVSAGMLQVPARAVPPHGPVGTCHPCAGGSGTPTPCPSCPLLVPTDVAVAGDQPSPKAEGPRRPPTR